MKRRDFLKRCAALGVSMPFFSFLEGCATEVGGRYDNFEVNFSGHVTIIGAGAAGLAAGYILDRYGVPFEILEAAPVMGGRVRRSVLFEEFPVDLGAEWLHAHPGLLAELVDDTSVDATVDLVRYSPDSLSIWAGGRLRQMNWATNFYGEYKFKRTTWFGFLEEFIAAGIQDRIVYDSPVTEVHYSDDRTSVVTRDGVEYETDRILVTVPVKILQGDTITFQPALPSYKQAAIDAVQIPHGIKVFIEFAERFYPDLTGVGALLGDEALNKIYYDAAFRKEAERNVLALFWVSDRAEAYTQLSDDEVIDAVLAELDEIFDGKASRHYVRHVVQNWTAEEFIGGAYTFGHTGDAYRVIRDLSRPINSRLYFAGEATDQENWATVHGAMQSGYAAVERLLGAP